MNKETIRKEYEETIQKRFELSKLISNFDTKFKPKIKDS